MGREGAGGCADGLVEPRDLAVREARSAPGFPSSQGRGEMNSPLGSLRGPF